MVNEDFEKIMEVARQQLTDGDAPAPRAMAEAERCLSRGDAKAAVELLLPLCEQLFEVGKDAVEDDEAQPTYFDLDNIVEQVLLVDTMKPERELKPTLLEQLFEVGKDAVEDDEAQPTYFDLDNIVEQVLLVDTMKPERELKPTLLPFVHTYALCAFALHAEGRYEEAATWLQRALVWNPVQPHLYFEISEAFKKMGRFDQADAWIDRAYVVCADPLALARWYRAKSFCAVEREEYGLAAAELLFSTAFEQSPAVTSELEYLKTERGQDFTDMDRETVVRTLQEQAAAELLFSTAFEQSPAVTSELEYLKTERGQDFTDMDRETVVRTLQEHHLPLGPNEAALQALATSVAIARENGDLPTARECALRLYGLTGDDSAKELYDSLVEE